LDELDTTALVLALHQSSAQVQLAVAAALPAVARAVDAIVERLQAGGHLHYFGAGTSGRLGVLDASEIPPTFGVSSEIVQGHIAGGPTALTDAVEGAEDSEQLGREAVRAAGLSPKDVAVAISASGRTPYALGALEAARGAGAFTIALVCNQASAMERVAELALVAPTGAEALAGSTRLNAGSAQKQILNLLSTAAMVRLGHTHQGLMVGVQATNEKLRARALRVLMDITGAKGQAAKDALESAQWEVRPAALMLLRGCTVDEARSRLAAAKNSLRTALAAEH
jgi:N-acetylmuramic acid 6-phosphate etherase